MDGHISDSDSDDYENRFNRMQLFYQNFDKKKEGEAAGGEEEKDEQCHFEIISQKNNIISKQETFKMTGPQPQQENQECDKEVEFFKILTAEEKKTI